MRAISNWLDRFCYKHPKLGIPNLMKYIVLANAAVFVLDLFTNSFASLLLCFHYNSIMHGQVWRLFTFFLVPSVSGGGSVGVGLMTNALLFALTSFFYLSIGTTLERYMGTTKFTLFYALGVILNMVYGMVTHSGVNMYYIHMSMFLSFAVLYPDSRVLLYGIIPLKVKWLAWLDAAFFAYDAFFYLSNGAPLYALMPLVAILNFFLFFGGELMGAAKYKKDVITYKAKRKVNQNTNRSTVNFQQAQKDIKQRKGYLHKCCVCGVTDADDGNMEFRYCSKCSGYHCYCMNHIANHTHVE